MKAKVTEAGVLVPKELLGDAEEVEITAGDGHVVVTPVLAVPEEPFDASLAAFGRSPVDDTVTDASVHHDRYIYGRR